MKLIGSLTSPYVRKVRVVMAEKKLDYQFVLDDPWSQATIIGESNPLGKVPTLIKADFSSILISRSANALSTARRVLTRPDNITSELRVESDSTSLIIPCIRCDEPVILA